MTTWGLSDIEVEIPNVAKDVEAQIENVLVDKSVIYSEYVQPEMVIEESEDVNDIRSEELCRIEKKEEGKLILKIDNFPKVILCCNALNEINVKYKVKTNIGFAIYNKIENIAVVSSNRFPDANISENLSGKIIESSVNKDFSEFTFDFTQEDFYDVTEEKLSKCVKKCKASYVKEPLDSSKEIYNHNVIELKKDEIINIEFKDDAFENIKDILEYANTLLTMNNDEILELFEKNFCN